VLQIASKIVVGEACLAVLPHTKSSLVRRCQCSTPLRVSRRPSPRSPPPALASVASAVAWDATAEHAS
jgi:hypothetical protein